MDWNAIRKVVGPILISLLKNTVSDLGTPTPPAPVPGVVPPGTIPHPSAAIRDLQSFLNAALTLNPPLATDGWIGPKTEAAIEQGISKLRAAGIGT